MFQIIRLITYRGFPTLEGLPIYLTLSTEGLLLSTSLYISIIQAFKLRKFAIGHGKRKDQNGKKPSWMTPISHGFHVVEDRLSTGEINELDSDSVVVQREENKGQELWFFSIFDDQIGDQVTKHMQSHLFDKKPPEVCYIIDLEK